MTEPATPVRSARPRLRTILAVLNVVVLILPIGGIAVMRLYESALIRQTESELIAQGAFVVAAYVEALHRLDDHPDATYGQRLPAQRLPDPDVRWHPRAAELDLATSEILPPPPEAEPAKSDDKVATQVGASLERLLIRAQRTTLAGIRVVDLSGRVVATTGSELGLSLQNRKEIAEVLAGSPVSVLRQRIGEEVPTSFTSISRGAALRIFVTTPIIDGDRLIGAVLLSRTPRTLVEALYGKRDVIAFAIAVLLASVLALALFTSLTISQPVRRLIGQARRAVQGERGAVANLEQPVTQEIDELSRAVAAMAQSLESREAYIRDFASHVSHEFKTPLTAMRGAIELLSDHLDEMDKAQRVRFLKNLDQDAERLQRLVGRLLELARADTLRPGQGESANLKDTLSAVAEQHESRMGLSVDASNCPGDVSVGMDAGTLASLLGALLDNSAQHGASQVTMAVETKGAGQANRVVLSVSDDGPGLSPANAEKVLEPFFTTAREKGGTGLGLTVVHSIIKAHGGSLEVAGYENGLTLLINLPQTLA